MGATEDGGRAEDLVPALVDGYLGQLAPAYSTVKREATRIYLLVHHLEFVDAQGQEQAMEPG
jgi:hypothetical protein